MNVKNYNLPGEVYSAPKVPGLQMVPVTRRKIYLHIGATHVTIVRTIA